MKTTCNRKLEINGSVLKLLKDGFSGDLIIEKLDIPYGDYKAQRRLIIEKGFKIKQHF